MIIAIVIIALIAGALKITGGVVYHSNTLFVDALTSVANIVVLLAIIRFKRMAEMPPDLEHHFGHERFEYAGVTVSIVAYSFVAGLAIAKLFYNTEYTVSFDSFYCALTATLLYLALVIYTAKSSPSLKAYGIFTLSEVWEGVAGIVASVGGSLVSYMVDYGLAVFLTAYIFIEVYHQGRGMVTILLDSAPPQSMYQNIVSLIESKGGRVRRLRLRVLFPGVVHGDAVVEGDVDVGALKRILREKRVDMCIEKVKGTFSEQHSSDYVNKST
mgnify:CR=1 FL=1